MYKEVYQDMNYCPICHAFLPAEPHKPMCRDNRVVIKERIMATESQEKAREWVLSIFPQFETGDDKVTRKLLYCLMAAYKDLNA